MHNAMTQPRRRPHEKEAPSLNTWPAVIGKNPRWMDLIAFPLFATVSTVPGYAMWWHLDGNVSETGRNRCPPVLELGTTIPESCSTAPSPPDAVGNVSPTMNPEILPEIVGRQLSWETCRNERCYIGKTCWVWLLTIRPPVFDCYLCDEKVALSHQIIVWPNWSWEMFTNWHSTLVGIYKTLCFWIACEKQKT